MISILSFKEEPLLTDLSSTVGAIVHTILAILHHAGNEAATKYL
jgi:hypothetical protein